MTMSFKLPDLGEGIHEGEILAIPVTVGQEIKEGDTIVDVETDKAAVEIPSPYTGVVKEILVKVGDIVNVGEVIMTFITDGESDAVDEPESLKEQAATAEGSLISDSSIKVSSKGGPIPASPATRRLARELGVDLTQVTPSGPSGLVTAEDVKSQAENGPVSTSADRNVPATIAAPLPTIIETPVLPDFSKWGEIERIPFRSIRRATAKQMVISWSQIPHVNSQDVVDVSKLEAFRQKHKAEIKDLGGNLTMTIFILKAVATALKTYPQFNATLDLDRSEIIMKSYYHIGVAVNAENGLIVPVVRDVDRKSIKELAIEVDELVRRTRERKAKVEEMQGGTFTITNAGAMGGGYFAPIINYPEVAILGVGQARMQPVVRENESGEHVVVPRLMMPIVLCIDHRVLDGSDALQFLKVLISTLEDPDQLLMSMV